MYRSAHSAAPKRGGLIVNSVRVTALTSATYRVRVDERPHPSRYWRYCFCNRRDGVVVNVADKSACVPI